jgi:periplasmic protein TonB
MIRHSSSFFFSLLFHLTLLIAIFFTWKNIPSLSKVDCEEKVCIQLCDVIAKKPLDKPTPKPKSKPKPIPKKVEKPKVKPKPIVKKIEIVKEIPEVVPEIEEEVVLEEVKEEEITEEKPVEVIEIVQEEVSEENIVVEDTDAKQARLEEAYMQEHIAQIIQLLQDNLYYPRRARKRGTIGEVIVKFTLSTNAVVHSIEVLSSKSEILSRAAIKTIEDLSGEFPKPTQELILHVPINYSLKM